MTAQPLTRKLGPLPVYGWALAALLGYLAYHYLRVPSARATVVPSSAGSGAQVPASGQGSPADNASSDLLDALGRQSGSYDALLAALQSGGGYGAAPGGGSGSADTSAATAPTVTDAGVSPDTAVNTAIFEVINEVNAGTLPPSALDQFGPLDPNTSEGRSALRAQQRAYDLQAATPAQAQATPGGVAVGSYYGTQTPFNPTSGATSLPALSYAVASVSPQPFTDPAPYATVAPAPIDTTGVLQPSSYGIGGKSIAS